MTTDDPEAERESAMKREASTKSAKREETRWHFNVALYHLRRMNSEMLPTHAVRVWTQLLKDAELVGHALEPPKEKDERN